MPANDSELTKTICRLLEAHPKDVVKLLFLLLLILLSLCQTPASADLPSFPQVTVEHIGSDKSDIVHCLLEGASRQFCKVGWGPAFNRLERIRISAPDSYGTELLIPEATETPFGFITSKRVIERLQGSLWANWKISPDLNFVLDWSEDPVCWRGGVLRREIDVMAGGTKVGAVVPGHKNYQFPLTNPLGERVWNAVSTSDSIQDRVKWGGSEIDRAIFAEFDFEDESSRSANPFSVQILPRTCKIEISNVQTVLNRESSDRALATMRQKAVDLADLMTTEALLYASKMQGSDGVKCLLANQLDSLRQAENIPNGASSSQLSDRSRENLRAALILTSQWTQYDSGEDPIAYLDDRRAEWLQACVGQDNQGLDQLQAVPDNAEADVKLLVSRFLEHKATLEDLLEDAWSLAVLLKLINEDNRRLQWMIDSTIKYRLTTKKDNP